MKMKFAQFLNETPAETEFSKAEIKSMTDSYKTVMGLKPTVLGKIKGKEVEFFEGVSTLRASSMISQAIESSLGAGGGSMSKIIYDASFVVNYVISVSNLLEVFPEYG